MPRPGMMHPHVIQVQGQLPTQGGKLQLHGKSLLIQNTQLLKQPSASLGQLKPLITEGIPIKAFIPASAGAGVPQLKVKQLLHSALHAKSAAAAAAPSHPNPAAGAPPLPSPATGAPPQPSPAAGVPPQISPAAGAPPQPSQISTLAVVPPHTLAQPSMVFTMAAGVPPHTLTAQPTLVSTVAGLPPGLMPSQLLINTPAPTSMVQSNPSIVVSGLQVMNQSNVNQNFATNSSSEISVPSNPILQHISTAIEPTSPTLVPVTVFQPALVSVPCTLTSDVATLPVKSTVISKSGSGVVASNVSSSIVGETMVTIVVPISTDQPIFSTAQKSITPELNQTAVPVPIKKPQVMSEIMAPMSPNMFATASQSDLIPMVKSDKKTVKSDNKTAMFNSNVLASDEISEMSKPTVPVLASSCNIITSAKETGSPSVKKSESQTTQPTPIDESPNTRPIETKKSEIKLTNSVADVKPNASTYESESAMDIEGNASGETMSMNSTEDATLYGCPAVADNIKAENADDKPDTLSATDAGNQPRDNSHSRTDTEGDFDPVEAMCWENGIGTLPGSDLKV